MALVQVWPPLSACGKLWRSAWILALGLVVMAYGEARASAWNQHAGDGLIIGDVTFSGGSHYFNGQGHLAPATLYEKQEFTGYLEYGLTDDVMLLLKPDLISTRVGGAVPGRYLGLGTSEAGAQLHVLSLGPAVVAVQASVRLPAVTDEKNPALIGNTSRDLDGRGLFGMPFWIGPWPSFVDLQAGYRLRSSGAPDEWHADITLGTRPQPRLLLLAQCFNTVAVGSGTAWFPASSWSKLKLSGVYDLTPTWSVELGLFTTMGGIVALRERGLQLGVWHRF